MWKGVNINGNACGYFDSIQRKSQMFHSSNTGLPQETRKVLTTQSNLIPKGTGKIRTNKSQS